MSVMSIARTIAASLLVVATLALPAGAQSSQSSTPPYEKDLLRLAEILGAVHYLRRLCEAGEGDAWRAAMEDLLQAENATGDRRATLIDRFNRGYRGFEQTYHTCNPTAVSIIERYMEEGSEIAQYIASRYGQ